MVRTLILNFVFVFLCTNSYSNKLLEYKEVEYFNADEIKNAWKKIDIPQLYLPVNNGVYVYEINFVTTYIDGTSIKSSGVALIPDNLYKDYSTIIYHNGTNIMKKREQTLGYNQFSICAGLAADGYLVVIPDYIGRGNSDKHQLYLNAKTESQNSVDMLLSLNEFLKLKGYDPIHDLFITGYSQGGHAAMSTQRLIETQYNQEFNLVASSPMSGPYDLSSTVVLDPNKKDQDWLLFMFMVKSFNDTYRLRNSLSEIFIAPWDSLAGVYFDGHNKYSGIRKGLPTNILEIFRGDFMQQEFFPENSRFKQILKENTIYEFIPQTPTQLCYCSDDEVVTAQNSKTAYNWMKKNGAKKIRIKDAGKNLDHEECAIYTVIYTKFFFDKYRDIKKSNFRNDFSNAALGLAKTTKKLFPRIKLF